MRRDVIFSLKDGYVFADIMYDKAEILHYPLSKMTLEINAPNTRISLTLFENENTSRDYVK